MRASSKRQFGGTVALLAGVGCATAIVEDEPPFVEPGTGGTSTTSTAGVGGTPMSTATGGVTATASAGRANGNAGISAAGRMGGAGMSAGSATCPNPLVPSEPGATQGNSGSFETTSAVCYFVEGTFNTWNCSNLGGRTVTVNGTPATCGGALPAAVDGGYYFEFGASSDGTNYTSFYWYTS